MCKFTQFIRILYSSKRGPWSHSVLHISIRGRSILSLWILQLFLWNGIFFISECRYRDIDISLLMHQCFSVKLYWYLSILRYHFFIISIFCGPSKANCILLHQYFLWQFINNKMYPFFKIVKITLLHFNNWDFNKLRSYKYQCSIWGENCWNVKNWLTKC